MTHRIRIYRSGALVCETQGVQGETLLDCIRAAGARHDAPCGGNGLCGKCLVRLGHGDVQALACRTLIDGDMDVYLPDEAEAEIIITPPAPASRLGVAIDIGTTTVVAHLTDMDNGARIATASGVNAQKAYGADVISRIQYSASHGHERLTKLIREQIASLIRRTCTISGNQASDIYRISIAANTVMQHFAAGLSPVGMGAAPFVPASLFGGELPAWQSLPVSDSAKVYFAPAVSSYIGGDVTAGLLAAGLDKAPGPVVYLDIGTNGEIALKSDEKYYCCATAAGPAFEGSEITMGMAAVSGAIDHVKWDGGLKVSVIGGIEPQGLCGSGLLDALATLRETGAVDETGRLLGPDELEHEITRHIEKADGKNVFNLSKGSHSIYITALDIRKLQLAKAAIAAGIRTLLHHAGVAEGQVRALVLAGGFGALMDKYSAARIGLFPTDFLPVTETLGNAAGEGAALALSGESARDTLAEIRGRCECIDLANNPVFTEQFIEQMMFE